MRGGDTKSIDHNLEILIIRMGEAGLGNPTGDLLKKKADFLLLSLALPQLLVLQKRLLLFIPCSFERAH